MTGEGTAWEWSSARALVSGDDETGVLNWRRLEAWGGCADWQRRLKQGWAASTEQGLRRVMRTGRPFADAAFRLEWERRFRVVSERESGGGINGAAKMAMAGKSR